MEIHPEVAPLKNVIMVFGARFCGAGEEDEDEDDVNKGAIANRDLKKFKLLPDVKPVQRDRETAR